MLNMIVGLSLGLVLFLCAITAYAIGLKHGRALAKGNIPEVRLNPVKATIQAVEQRSQKKEAAKVTDELSDMLNYDISAALDAVKKER